jgi:hypothetical protein
MDEGRARRGFPKTHHCTLGCHLLPQKQAFGGADFRMAQAVHVLFSIAYLKCLDER